MAVICWLQVGMCPNGLPPKHLRQWQVYPVSAILQETLETRSVSLEARI
jgi:hypothetical protein